MNGQLTISILEDDATIQRLAIEEIAKELNIAFKVLIPKLKTITGEFLRRYIMAQPEYDAIITGDLRYELGIVNPSARLITILDTLVRNIETDFVPFVASGNSLSGGLTINAVKSDYSDIIHLRDSIVTTEKGVELEWLRWLLLEGRQIIIAGYDVELGPFGRTGGAHMVLGGNWKVPAEYAGRTNDNFIIRAIKTMQEPLKEKLEECIASI